MDLIVADNQLDAECALGVADRLLAQRLDLLIEYQVDTRAGEVIMTKCRDAGVPVIAVDIPMLGATFFGVDNYRAGYMAGAALGTIAHTPSRAREIGDAADLEILSPVGYIYSQHPAVPPERAGPV